MIKDPGLVLNSSEKPPYEKPVLMELGSISQLTLGGQPSSGLDQGKQCRAGAAQTAPPHCL